MKIFWDTNLFIYLWEESPWQATVREFSRFLIARNHTLVTSALTVGEILVQPARSGNENLRKTYFDAFRSLVVVPFDLKAADRFAELRARYPTLRPPDAIQLACAGAVGSELFVSNDTRLTSFEVSGIGRMGSLGDWKQLVGGT